jgi:hypothetical protein
MKNRKGSCQKVGMKTGRTLSKAWPVLHGAPVLILTPPTRIMAGGHPRGQEATIRVRQGYGQSEPERP